MRVAFRTADVWLLFPTAESVHWFYLNAAIWLGQTQAIFFFFLVGSLTLFLPICVGLHRSVLNGTIWFVLPFLPCSQLFLPFPFCCCLAFLSFTFYLWFFNPSTQFSQNRFPPLHHFSNSQQPAAFVHRYATHDQMTVSTKRVCVCACVCVRKEREKLIGNHFVSDLSKLCGSWMPCFFTWSIWFSILCQ